MVARAHILHNLGVSRPRGHMADYDRQVSRVPWFLPSGPKNGTCGTCPGHVRDMSGTGATKIRMTNLILTNMTFPLPEYWASSWLLGFPVLYPVQMANTARHHHQIIKLFKIYLSHQISQRFIGWLNTYIRYNPWFWGTKCVSAGYFTSEIQCFVTRECVNMRDWQE